MSGADVQAGLRGRSTLGRLLGDRLVALALAVVLGYALIAALVALGVLAAAPDARVGAKLLGPGAGHWLGTDLQGRDVLRRTLHAVKPAIAIGLVSALVATVVGALLGALAGWLRGAVDVAVVWLYSTLQSIPSILLLVALAFVAGRGLAGVYLAFLATFWIGPCRVVRAEVLRLREVEWVEAARALGYGPLFILRRHLLPHTLPVVIPSAVVVFIEAIKSEVILSYLGLGVVGEPSWGTMIHQASTELVNGAYWQLAAPTAAMALLVLALTVLSSALGEALDPRAAPRRP